MTKWKEVPVEPTEAMLAASRKALTELIMSVPEPERTKRFGKPTERGYQISGPEKTVARWRAMIAAAPTGPQDIANRWLFTIMAVSAVGALIYDGFGRRVIDYFWTWF